MSYIIASRNPLNGLIVFMEKDNSEIEQFELEADADLTAYIHPLFSSWGYQVLEID